MSDPSVGELFQETFSDVVDSLSPIRTQQVVTFLGNILTTLLTIFINTITKLFMITVAKVFLLALLKHLKISDIFFDFALSRKSPLVNIEDASIHYSSPGDEYPYNTPGEEYGGSYDDNPVFVYGREGERGQRGLWEDLLEWVVFDIL